MFYLAKMLFNSLYSLRRSVKTCSVTIEYFHLLLIYKGIASIDALIKTMLSLNSADPDQPEG